ncbi:hypothetical protein [Streptomyces sp. ITFR-16]|uniref:hypothetical protein n=1 Tax=Streptomyces sp. ITFR-16 TaxID=3075198 RepID=UPI00288BDF27|nr:hypothetical protein [Streptomyces sp. ITFR-16]WNI26345.1 hypothetical protein RLT58_32690 [Streptomyces sp. ITFR-16]
MKLCVAIPVVLPALLLADSGAAALARGWVLPTNRRPVHRPRPYGWAQLTVACALCRQLVFLLVLDDVGTRQWGTLAGSVLLVAGLVAMAVSHRAVRGGGGGAGSQA